MRDKYKLNEKLYKSIEREELSRVKAVLKKVINDSDSDDARNNQNQVNYIKVMDNTFNQTPPSNKNWGKHVSYDLPVGKNYNPATVVDNPVFGNTFYLENQLPTTRREDYVDRSVSNDNVFATYKRGQTKKFRIAHKESVPIPMFGNAYEETKNMSRTHMTRLKSETDEPSEIDMDEYLLGKGENDQESINDSFNHSPGKNQQSNIEVGEFDQNRSNNKKLNQYQPENSNEEYLQPHYQRSNTGDRKELRRRMHRDKNGKILPRKANIKKTITGINTVKPRQKIPFGKISPVKMVASPELRNACNVSELPENMPSAFISVPSYTNERPDLEEIVELQTRENFESNPLNMLRHNNRKFSNEQASMLTFNKQNSPEIEKSGKFLTVKNETRRKSQKDNAIFGSLIKWTKGSRLGFGVFGDVVKAMNKETGEMIAVKRLNLIKSPDEYNSEAIETLKNEIKILKEVEHKNIIRYIGSEIIKEDF